MFFRFATTAVLLMGVIGHSQTLPSNAELMTEVPHAKIGSILNDLGIVYTEQSSGESRSYFFQLNGYTVVLVNDLKTIVLWLGYVGGADIQKANEWNRANRFGRAYVDKGGRLENDLSFAGGVTAATIKAFINQFGATQLNYLSFMGIKQPTAGTKPGLLVFNSKMDLKYDSKKWQHLPMDSDRFMFTLSTGDGFALIITERDRPMIGKDSLPDMALSNLKATDPNARIVLKERRSVNGVDMWFVKLDAIVNNKPVVYCGYLYPGEDRIVQVVAYSEKALFAEHENDFMEFLNGFSVRN